MSDHDFEKQVKQKMDELRFRPSDAVWTGVARELRKERPSRRWLWLSVLIITLGSAGYYTFNNYYKSANSISQNTPPDTNDNTPGKEENAGLKNPAPDEAGSTYDNSSTDKSTSDKSVVDQSSIDKSAIVESPITRSSKEKSLPVTSIDEKTAARNTPVSKTQTKKDGLSDKISTSQDNDVVNNVVNNNKTDREKPGTKPSQKYNVQPKQKPLMNLDRSVQENQSIVNNKQNRKAIPESGNKVKYPSSGGIATGQVKALEKTGKDVELNDTSTGVVSGETRANDPAQNEVNKTSGAGSDSGNTKKQIASAITETDSAASVTTVPQKISKKNSSWDWGFTATGGISNLTDDFLANVLKSTNMADAAPQSMPTNSYVGAPSTLGVPPPAASAVKAGPYFSVGGFVRKKLSKRFSVSAGLQYSQFNNTIDVGYRVDSSRLVNNGAQVMNVSRYYRANQTSKFSNRYYFLDLPVSLHTQLNRSVKLPVFWNLDFHVSQMLGSDALVYDSGTGVYYKDKSIYHKTQFRIGTGFSLGIFSKSKTPLWIGPSVKYNATKLFNKEVAGEKHLLSAGLDVKLFINKK